MGFHPPYQFTWLIYKALEQREFVLHYQSKINGETHAPLNG